MEMQGMRMENKREIDLDVLWLVALHGSPLSAAIALAILDRELNGKISEFKQKYVDAPQFAGSIPAGSKNKGGVVVGEGKD